VRALAPLAPLARHGPTLAPLARLARPFPRWRRWRGMVRRWRRWRHGTRSAYRTEYANVRRCGQNLPRRSPLLVRWRRWRGTWSASSKEYANPRLVWIFGLFSYIVCWHS